MWRCGIALCIAGLGWFAGLVHAETADELGASLTVTPVLCITTPQAPDCSIDFYVRWKADRPHEYCVHNDYDASALECWRGQLQGELNDTRVVSESFHYWLTGLGFDVRLSEVEVAVLSARSDDRRRNRRRRHVWSIL